MSSRGHCDYEVDLVSQDPVTLVIGGALEVPAHSLVIRLTYPRLINVYDVSIVLVQRNDRPGIQVPQHSAPDCIARR